MLDDIVFPCAGYIAMVGEAVRQISGVDDYSLRNMVIKTGLVLQDSHDAEIITSLRPVRLTATLDSTWYEFSISSYNGSIWTKHCTGQARPGKDDQQHSLKQSYEIKTLLRKVASPYSAMRKVGLNYGNTFQGLNDISAMPGESTAVATLALHLKSESNYQLHPTTIDHCKNHTIRVRFHGAFDFIKLSTDFVQPFNYSHLRPVKASFASSPRWLSLLRLSTSIFEAQQVNLNSELRRLQVGVN